MGNEEIKARLTPVFHSVFADDDLEVTEGLTADQVPGWDLLSHINLIVAVEKEFKIKFTTKDVRSMKNVGNMIELISNKAA